MTEKENMENAEVLEDNNSKNFLSVVNFDPLEISDYDALKRHRVSVISKIGKIELKEENYKELKKAKNTLVKERTDLDKRKKSDKEKVKNVYNKFVDNVEDTYKELYDIHVPIENKYAKYVSEIDDKAKKEQEEKDRIERERIELITTTLSDFKFNTERKINNIMGSAGTFEIKLPEIDYMEYENESLGILDALKFLRDEKIQVLADREELARLKAEMAKKEKVAEANRKDIQMMPSIKEAVINQPKTEQVIENASDLELDDNLTEEELDNLLPDLEDLDALLDDSNAKKLEDAIKEVDLILPNADSLEVKLTVRDLLFSFYNYCMNEQDGELREEYIDLFLNQEEVN